MQPSQLPEPWLRLGKVKDPENPLDIQRYEAFDLLRSILLDNLQFKGVFSCWEPEAYDFMDTGFQNERGHEESGRFSPYWQRNENKLEIVSILSCPSHSPNQQPGLWYTIPQKTKTEYIQDPYAHPFHGGSKLIVSTTVPILADNEFQGIVGIDLALDFIGEQTESFNYFDRSGNLMFISENGMILGSSSNKKLTGQYLSNLESNTFLYIKNNKGKERVSTEDGMLVVLTPFTIGRTGVNWWVKVSIPLAKINEEAIHLMYRQIIIFIGIMTIIIILAFMGAKNITRPILQLLRSIQYISKGDFSHSVSAISNDEIGDVAIIFDKMRVKLQNTLEELKQHQEQLEEKVIKRTLELSDKNSQLNEANEELVKTMSSLRETQEELLGAEKLAVVGQMSGIVAHEVLNPVTSISLRIENNIRRGKKTIEVLSKLESLAIQLKEQFNSNTKEQITSNITDNLAMLEKIGAALKRNQEARQEDQHFLQGQIFRVTKIIDNLRQMSKTKKQIESIEVNALVNEIIVDMQDSFNKRKIEIITELPPVPIIKADHMEIYSVISNIMRNAMQAIEKNQIVNKRQLILNLSTIENGKMIELTITDTGTGISTEELNLLFETGFTSKGREGTGLGLNYSRKIARSYGGDIDLIWSEPGKGSKFQILLDLTTLYEG
jgi:signal transduction histidine kinase